MSNLNSPSEKGFYLNINSIVQTAWGRYKEDIWIFLGMGVLFFLINLVISTLPYISFIGNFTSTLLFSGFYIYSKNKELGTQRNSDFWGGLHFAGNLLLYQLTVMVLIVPLLLISTSSIIPFDTYMLLATGELNVVDFSNQINEQSVDLSSNILMGMILVFLLAIYFSVSFMFAAPLIVNSKLGFWHAMELSRKTVGKQFFAFLFFWILFIMVMGGAILLTLGFAFFFFNPFLYLIIYEMYDQVFIKQELNRTP